MSNRIPSLDDNNLQLLHEKHSSPKNADDKVLTTGEKPSVHPVIYESIDEDLVK